MISTPEIFAKIKYQMRLTRDQYRTIRALYRQDSSVVPAIDGDALQERYRPRLGRALLERLSGDLQRLISTGSANSSQGPYLEACLTRVEGWLLGLKAGATVRPRMTDIDIDCLLRCNLTPADRSKIERIRTNGN